MLYKKIKQILITALVTIALLAGTKLYMHYRSVKAFIPRPVQAYQVDINSLRIKEVLNTRKIIALEINASVKSDAQNYIKPKHQALDGIYQTLTKTQLTLENNYVIAFNYDISKAQFVDNGDKTYTIILNAEDITINVINEDTQKIKEKCSIMGDKFPTEKVLQLLEDMRNDAIKQIRTQDNFQRTITNVQNTLLDLFKSVGVETTKVNFR